MKYNIIGVVVWGGGIPLAGYFLGEIPFVKNNIEIVIIVFVVVSSIPIALEILRARRQAKREGLEKAAGEAVAN